MTNTDKEKTDNHQSGYTHNVYTIDRIEGLVFTKIGVAKSNDDGGFSFDVNSSFSSGDILIYRQNSN